MDMEMGEASMLDPEPVEMEIGRPIASPTYHIVREGSQKGKDVLVESDKYSFVRSRERGGIVYWRCAVRSKQITCRATITQRRDTFSAGRALHNHPPNEGCIGQVEIVTQVKRNAKEHMFAAAASLVEEAYRQAPVGTSLPNPDNLARRANRLRAAVRPRHPDDLDFLLNEDFVPDSFLRGDIRVDDRRHLLFASDRMLELLTRAKHWYADATFFVVKRPFTQLFSIHVFLKSGDTTKQLVRDSKESRVESVDEPAVSTTSSATTPTMPTRMVVGESNWPSASQDENVCN
ncbi:hypothetical protein LSAT2_021485 [Lamellibrachia satsuma]|nr:hypothetical protein LSAT2_021485 [Lamellibrachia satsuma]